jgi:hypothetical protein
VEGEFATFTIDRLVEEESSYDSIDGQECVASCMDCQRGLKGLSREARKCFAQDVGKHITSGAYDPLATEEEQCEQRKALHDKEQIAMDDGSLVWAHISHDDWMKNRCKTRKGKTVRGTMTAERYVEIYQGQYQRCCFSGMRMELPSGTLMGMSADRIDSDLNYDEGNVQFALLRCNLAKNKHKDRAYRRHLAVLYKSPHIHKHSN